MTVIDARTFLAIGIAFLAALLVSVSNKYPNIRETWSAIGSITMFGVIISMVGGVLNGAQSGIAGYGENCSSSRTP